LVFERRSHTRGGKTFCLCFLTGRDFLPRCCFSGRRVAVAEQALGLSFSPAT
jgi:hypothetical protein